MTDSTGPAPGIPGEIRPPVRFMVSGGLRALGTTAALVAIYYLLPLDHTSTWIAAITLIIGLVAFIALVIFQARWIIRARFPGLRAVEALATSLPLFPAAVFRDLRRHGGGFRQQLRRETDPHRRAVLHRHRIHHGRVR